MAEGRARVILGGEGLDRLEDGEILVAQTTSTSWTPYFAKIAAAVLDVGGVMCHAAIVAREYSLPAVVGTGTGTKQIRTGDRIRVDADAGTVTFLQRVPLDSTQRSTRRPLTDRKERHMPTGQEGSA